MKYDHVGRPTNEEVKQKKRKKMMKISIPVVVILLLTIVVAKKMDSQFLMGNSVISYEYTCPDGWNYNKYNQTCSMTKNEDVYLLGDADHNFKLEYKDYIVLRNAVNSKKVLDNIDQAIYDINKDNTVDKGDLIPFTQLSGISSTGGKLAKKRAQYVYICPKNYETDGIKTTYKLTNNRQCKVTRVMKANKVEKIYDESELTDEYSTGDTVELNGSKYYVIADSSKYQKYVTLLKETPLNAEEVVNYGKDHINRYTVESKGKVYNHKGYGVVNYYSSKTCGYINGTWTYDGCKNNYNESDVKYIVDNWANDNFNKNELMEIDGYKARLINYNEFLNIGEYSWKYSPNYNYWSMTPVKEYSGGVWTVSFDGYWATNTVNEHINKTVDGDEYMVVRPVINVDKRAITKTYKVGNTVSINGSKYYVIADSGKNQEYVTLLKETPLNVEEVVNYGKDHINRYTVESKGKVYNHNGYGVVAYYSSPTCGYTVTRGQVETECKNNYNDSDVKHIVDNWANDSFYKNELIEIDGYKARLITEKEFQNINNYSFKSDSSYNYWSMTPVKEYSGGVWQVSFDGYWGTLSVNENISKSVDGDEYMTVRPVINIKKSSI